MLGALQVRPICNVVNWDGTPEAKAGGNMPPKIVMNDSLPPYKYSARDMRSFGWEISPEFLCSEGRAICGFAVSDGSISSGINEIKILCCPFPAAQG